MKLNIFLRSMRRQPIRTLLLLLLVVVVVFAFTARATEYLLLRQETERLGGYYKAIGEVRRLGDDWNHSRAACEDIKAFLESDERVAYTVGSRMVGGLLPDMYNADLRGLGIETEYKSTHRYFTGTLLGYNEVHKLERPIFYTEEGLEWGLCCYFRQEEALAGAPEVVWPGHIVPVFVPREDVATVLQSLQVGRQYLVCGSSCSDLRWSEDNRIEKPTVQDPTIHRYGEMVEDVRAYQALPLIAGGPMFYALPASGEIDWNDPLLTGVKEEIALCRQEMGGLQVCTAGDMTVMPRKLEGSQTYPVDGRWLTHEDDVAQNKVCVIHENLAEMRGLSIGDTIDITLRDVKLEDISYGYLLYPHSQAYETATQTYQIVGTYGTLDADWRNHWGRLANVIYIPESTVPESFHANDHDMLWGYNLYFVLTSPALEEEFLADTRDALAALGAQVSMRGSDWGAFQEAVRPMLRSSLYNLVIFALVLLTALCLVAFLYLRARRKDMAIARALGVSAGVCVRQGALPLAMIGLIGTACGAVAGWQYALATGANTLATLGTLGKAATEGVTEAVTETATSAALPRYWLAAILGGVFLLVLLLALGGMAYLTRKPVLELLTGSAQVKQKEETAAQLAALDAGATDTTGARTAGMPAGIPAGTLAGVAGGGAVLSPQPARRARGVAHTLRFVGCYIRRSAVKSALVLLLAVLFTVGLAAIRIAILHSGARVDELFNTVSVPVMLISDGMSNISIGGGYIAQRTVDRIQKTGFVQSAYLEGQCGVMRLRREDVYLQDIDAAGAGNTQQQPALREGDTGENISGRPAAWMLFFDDLDAFMTIGRGAGAADNANAEKMEITWQDGWDESMFAQDYADSDVLPVLMPQFLYEVLQIPADGRVALNVLWEDTFTSHTSVVQVAGTYTGTLTPGADASEERSYLLAPSGVMPVVMEDHAAYSTVHFALDPGCNRQLEEVRAALDEIIARPDASLFALRAVVQDEELKQAVEPLENSIRLMETLFPVALALSLLAAVGVSALLILTEAREAAIMRVLGTTKLRTRIILSLQVILMVLAGLMLGLAVALAWAGSLGLAAATAGLALLCATAYLLCATTGSSAGAVMVTRRPPLELLQVKE